MKILVTLAVLFSSACAHAGSNSCTNTDSISWYQSNPYYTLSSSQCILEASQAEGGNLAANASLLVTLPSGASDGDQFTIKDTTDYSFDVCDTYYDDPQYGGDGTTYNYCIPGGFGFQVFGSHFVGNDYDGYSESYSVSGFYYTSIVDANNNPVTIPSAYSKHRYKLTVTYNALSGNWDASYSQL